MKSIALVLLTAGISTAVSSATVLAFWDFNTPYDYGSSNPVPVQIVHNASIGAGIIYQQRGEMDLNGKTGVAYTDAPNSIDVAAGKGMGWNDIATSTVSDAEFFVTFSTTGYSNIVISFDIQGNDSSGISRYDLKYSFSNLQDVTGVAEVNGTIKDFDPDNYFDGTGNNVIETSFPTFTRITINLNSVPLANFDDKGFVALRFDDWKDNKDMAIDNLLVTGTAIPEPAVGMMGALCLLVLARRRR